MRKAIAFACYLFCPEDERTRPPFRLAGAAKALFWAAAAALCWRLLMTR